MCGGVLDASERLVDREHVGDVLCAISTEFVVPDAVNRGEVGASGAADSKGEHV